ncbi:MAG: hypothetical protein ACOX1L_05905 [Erysipelotrichaceae bacterium]|jgi:hypothetical protein
MNIKKQFKSDIEKISLMNSNKEKIQFIWDYYKIPIIVVLVTVSISLISFVSNLGKENVAMYVVMVNSNDQFFECDDTVFARKLIEAGIDMEGKVVDITADLILGQGNNQQAESETMQYLNALFTISDLDIFMAEEIYFELFVQQGAYADLNNYIEKDLLDKYCNDLYYYQNSSGQLIPVGIVLHADSIIHKAGYYHNDVVLGICSRAMNMDAAIKFVIQMLSDYKMNN